MNTKRWIVTEDELQYIEKNSIVNQWAFELIRSRPADDIPPEENYSFDTVLDWIHRAKTAEKLVRESRNQNGGVQR